MIDLSWRYSATSRRLLQNLFATFAICLGFELFLVMKRSPSSCKVSVIRELLLLSSINRKEWKGGIEVQRNVKVSEKEHLK